MALHGEPRGTEFVQFPRAALDIKDLSAGAAMKMMMVSQSSGFIAGRLPGDIDGG